MSDTPAHTNSNGDRPTSWRDVYSLVQDVEQRLTDRIDDAAMAARVSVSDHETRIRTLEAAVPVTKEAAAAAAAALVIATALETASKLTTATRTGQRSIITYGQKVVLFFVVVVNVAIAVITFLRPA